jgi:hypothetical protein
MSWDQEYTVPSFEALLQRLAGITGTQLLIDHLEAKGIKIIDVEEVLLGNGVGGDASGAKVRLSDGRVYIPKLVERVTANGNYGNDIYDWYEIGEEPIVIATDRSEGVATPEELAAAEADLESDGEPCTCTGIDHCHCDSDRFCTPACSKDLGYSPAYEDEDEDSLYSGCDDQGCGCGW